MMNEKDLVPWVLRWWALHKDDMRQTGADSFQKIYLRKPAFVRLAETLADQRARAAVAAFKNM
jgi:hypothetical protein